MSILYMLIVFNVVHYSHVKKLPTQRIGSLYMLDYSAASSSASICLGASGFINGNNNTSRMDAESVKEHNETVDT